jgi:hypothetical protein
VKGRVSGEWVRPNQRNDIALQQLTVNHSEADVMMQQALENINNISMILAQYKNCFSSKPGLFRGYEYSYEAADEAHIHSFIH